MSHQPVKGRVDGANPYSAREPPLGLTTTITANLPIKEDDGGIKESPIYGEKINSDLSIRQARYDQDFNFKPAPLFDPTRENAVLYYFSQGYATNEIARITGESLAYIDRCIAEEKEVRKIIASDSYLRSAIGIQKAWNMDGVPIEKQMTFSTLIDFIRNRGYNQEDAMWMLARSVGEKRASEIVGTWWPIEILA